MTVPVFKCAKCGSDTELAAPDPANTVCPNCCEDHDYEFDSCANWAMCQFCNAPAPDDYYADDTGI